MKINGFSGAYCANSQKKASFGINKEGAAHVLDLTRSGHPVNAADILRIKQERLGKGNPSEQENKMMNNAAFILNELKGTAMFKKAEAAIGKILQEKLPA